MNPMRVNVTSVAPYVMCMFLAPVSLFVFSPHANAGAECDRQTAILKKMEHDMATLSQSASDKAANKISYDYRAGMVKRICDSEASNSGISSSNAASGNTKSNSSQQGSSNSCINTRLRDRKNGWFAYQFINSCAHRVTFDYDDCSQDFASGSQTKDICKVETSSVAANSESIVNDNFRRPPNARNFR